MTKQEMLKILEENKNLIENNNFQEFYGNLYYYQRSYFTDLFLKSGINPLDYMTKIPQYYAFDLNILKNTNIPKNVKNIGYGAFSNCINLTNVTISTGVTRIGEYAFKDCINLKSIEIPNDLTIISDSAFVGCTSLIDIKIPKSLKSIRDYAFSGCSKLTDVYYEGSQQDWEKIYIEEGNDYLQNATIHYNSKI